MHPELFKNCRNSRFLPENGISWISRVVVDIFSWNFVHWCKMTIPKMWQSPIFEKYIFQPKIPEICRKTVFLAFFRDSIISFLCPFCTSSLWKKFLKNINSIKSYVTKFISDWPQETAKKTFLEVSQLRSLFDIFFHKFVFFWKKNLSFIFHNLLMNNANSKYDSSKFKLAFFLSNDEKFKSRALLGFYQF